MARDKFDEQTIRERRTFPVGYTILLAVLITIQVLALFFALSADPQPQDVIRSYEITVTPQPNGSLNVQYTFEWKPLDLDEPLTWIEIGMANPDFTVVRGEHSVNLTALSHYTDDEGYVSLRLDLDRAYRAGELLKFTFTVNQERMLCKTDGNYFYEFVPGWFNATPVEHYKFRWKDDGVIASNADSEENGYLVWEGEMPCGWYSMMSVKYGEDAFADAQTVSFFPFDDSGCYDALRDEKISGIFMAIFVCLILGVIELYIVDCYVSYHRGRGFLMGYGYHVHYYGSVNPAYRNARNRHQATHGRGGGGGGCACACACACASGGRAGCSQKDFYKKDER